MTRSGIALVAALLIIAAGALTVRMIDGSFEQKSRQGLRAAKAAGRLPSGIDPETADLGDFGMELSPAELRRLKVAHFLVSWRFALIPFVLLTSLGIARILRRNGD